MSKKLKIDVEEFTKACRESLSMAEACSKLGMHFNTFRKVAKELGVYDPNPSGKGIKKTSDQVMTLEKFQEQVITGRSRGLSGTRLKSYLFRLGLKENKCEICGQPPEWNGKPLVLELDHINGDHYDNRLENLRIICAHCHSQTETFRAKNKK